MADVLKPGAFNESFTIYLNATGKPVQRTLAEMTASEVLAAVRWCGDEANRLEREAVPFTEMAKTIIAGGEIPPETPQETLENAISTLRSAAAANAKSAHLIELVRANVPQWKRHSDMTMGEAVRRFWPGGRAS